jgi:hypothetical protein
MDAHEAHPPGRDELDRCSFAVASIFEGWGKPLAPTRLGRACSDRVVDDDDPRGVAEDRRRCRWRVRAGCHAAGRGHGVDDDGSVRATRWPEDPPLRFGGTRNRAPIGGELAGTRRARVRAALADDFDRPFGPRELAALERDRNYFERVALNAGKYTERLDFAVAASQVVQLTQAWSFQVPNEAELSQRVRAWPWTMRHLRSDGGSARLGGDRVVSVPRDVDVEVVYVPPDGPHAAKQAFHDSQAVFEELNIAAHEDSKSDAVAHRATELLEAAALR